MTLHKLQRSTARQDQVELKLVQCHGSHSCSSDNTLLSRAGQGRAGQGRAGQGQAGQGTSYFLRQTSNSLLRSQLKGKAFMDTGREGLGGNYLDMWGGVSTIHWLRDIVHAPGNITTICTLAVSARMADSSFTMHSASSGHLKPLQASTTKPAGTLR